MFLNSQTAYKDIPIHLKKICPVALLKPNTREIIHKSLLCCIVQGAMQE